MSAQAGNSFLQGLMGGANFVDTIQSRAAEREWQKTERAHKQEEWQREKDLRQAQSDYYKQAWRTQELSNLYDYSKQNLTPQQQKELLHYATSDVFNDTDPDLVNHGAASGETKKMLPPKHVQGGIVPQVGVYDKDGKMIRQGHLTQDRTDKTPAMIADGGVVPDYFIKSRNADKALANLRAKIVSLGGKPPETPESYQTFYDQNGNRLQRSSRGKESLVVSAKKGKGSGSGGMKNMQYGPDDKDATFQIQVGTHDGKPVMKDATIRSWFDPNSGRYFEATYVNNALYGKARDVTNRVAGTASKSGGGGQGLNTDIDGKPSPGKEPKPDKPKPDKPKPGGMKPPPAPPPEPSTPTTRAQAFNDAGGVVAAKAKDFAKQFQKPVLTTSQIKKAKRLAKEGKWEEVAKILPPDKVKQLKKQTR